MTPLLTSNGAKLVIHDFTKQDGVNALAKMTEKVGLPSKYTSHMLTFIPRGDGTVVLLGHPPRALIEQALQVQGGPKKIMMRQDEMNDAPKTYDLWPFTGEMKTFPINTPLEEALRQMGALNS